MVQMEGKYAHQKNENLDEYFKALGKSFCVFCKKKNSTYFVVLRGTIHPKKNDVFIESFFGDK